MERFRQFLAKTSPALIRFSFDLAVVLLNVVLLGLLFEVGFSIQHVTLASFAAGCVALAINGALGLFGRARLVTIWKKAALLVVSAAAAAATGVAIGAPFVWGFLYATFTFVLMLMPRFFLNWPNEPTGSMVRRTIREKGWTLVVGGAGYIGSHVVAQLLSKNHRVRVLDGLFYGDGAIQEFMANPNFELVRGDATDLNKLVSAMNGASSVIHLAGLVGDPACAVDESFTRHTNVIATRMVKEVARAYGVERLVFASSCSVYGASDVQVNETSELSPVSLYAMTKIDSEQELLASTNEDFSVVILRFATVFGHSRRPRFDLVANLFSAQAFNDHNITVVGPDQWRPFIHCLDVARACVMAIEAPVSRVRGQIFNVGDERLNMTIGELGNIVRNAATAVGVQTDVTVRDNVLDRRNYRVSFAKIKEQLGFEAKMTLDEGVREILTHLKNGDYEHYKAPQYSNLEITKTQITRFNDPLQSATLYRPLSEPRMASI